MKKNMGTIDRVIRSIIGITIGVLFFTGRISGTIAVVLGVIAMAFLSMSLVAWCPVYAPLGLSTRKD
jgi:hypothetical protein